MIKIIEKPELPKEIAQAKAPAVLMSQAVRVFLANQRQGTQSALTRAEVNRTRKKIFKQKGTGHARHGDRKAPIFVGGGIAFAPKPRDYSLSLPAKMSKLARFGAMLAKSKDNGLVVVSGLGQIDGKTSTVSKFLSEVSKEQVKFLLVTDVVRDNVYRAARNIRDCEVTTWGQVNTYQILRADKVIVMQEAFENKVEKSEEEPKVEKSEKKAVVKKVVKAKK